MDLFDQLPIAAIINGTYFCIHGGIAPQLTSIEKLNRINRKGEPANNALLSDLLWADPAEEDEENSINFCANYDRGTSCKFGSKPLRALLAKSKLTAMVRAHEAQMDGFKFHMKAKNNMPLCVTVFSAPNYCGFYGNKAAIFCTSSDNKKDDMLTFKEEDSKPVILRLNELGRDNVDAISFYMNKLIGHVSQAMIDIMQTAATHSEKTSYSDLDYLKKVTAASLKKPEITEAMVSAELTKQSTLTEEEKFDRELEEMADDLGVGDVGSSEQMNRISVNHQSLATSRSAS